MTSRLLVAAGAALLLLLTGCGGGEPQVGSVAPTATASSADPGDGPRWADAPRAASTPADPPGPPDRSAPAPAPADDAAPSPTASPTVTAGPTAKSVPLPPGLRRTTGTRGIALTFDDGPHPVWTPKVLDQLRRHGVTATFCVVGSRVREHPGLVARIVREGHQLCNHTWRHDVELGGRTPDKIRADLVRTTEAILAAVPDAQVPFYRQPGGRWTPEVVAVAKELGMVPLHWTVDPQDWAKPTAKAIAARVSAGIRPGAVVLLHDGGGDRAATVAACPALIAEIKGRYGVAALT